MDKTPLLTLWNHSCLLICGGFGVVKLETFDCTRDLLSFEKTCLTPVMVLLIKREVSAAHMERDMKRPIAHALTPKQGRAIWMYSSLARREKPGIDFTRHREAGCGQCGTASKN
jgi:hypothetical protein